MFVRRDTNRGLETDGLRSKPVIGTTVVELDESSQMTECDNKGGPTHLFFFFSGKTLRVELKKRMAHS
jgi:hypothetical protein